MSPSQCRPAAAVSASNALVFECRRWVFAVPASLVVEVGFDDPTVPGLDVGERLGLGACEHAFCCVRWSEEMQPVRLRMGRVFGILDIPAAARFPLSHDFLPPDPRAVGEAFVPQELTGFVSRGVRTSAVGYLLEPRWLSADRSLAKP